MPLSAGTRLGPYEIFALIGAGGMGEVYKARDTRLDRVVAIKISNEKFSERFEREAHAIAALNHPHVCALYDVGPDYLVMEYIEGQPLHGPVAVDDAIRTGIQIAEALEHAHAYGVVHRDLKPGNILATRGGIKVLDFGLAKLNAQEDDRTLTVVGGVLGTPRYMAPEQRLGQPADARTDIYALGLILQELTTGRPPDAQSDPAACGALEPVVRICLTQNADDRWQSARDVRHALEMLAHASASSPAKKGGSFWKWCALVLAVTAAGMAGFALWPRPAAGGGETTQFEINPPPGAQFIDGSAVSPDGKQIAMLADTAGTTSVWIRSLESLAVRKLAGTDGARGVFWSPDGRSLAFGLQTNLLKRIDLSSGATYTISSTTVPVVNFRGSWARDGTMLFDPYLGGPLQRRNATGGTSAPALVLRKGSETFSQTSPQFLPDGRHFIYLERTSSSQTQGIYVASLDQPQDSTLMLRTSSSARLALVDGRGYLLWLRSDGALVAQPVAPNLRQLEGEVKTLLRAAGPDFSVAGSTLIYRAGQAAENRLLWYDRSGKPPAGLAQPAINTTKFAAPRLSADGRRVIFDRVDDAGSRDLWQVELSRGASRRMTVQQNGGWGAWSPDGSELVLSIAFVGGATGTRRLARLSAGGGTAPRPFPLEGIPGFAQYAHDWSPDGRFVAFVNVDANPDIWILPLASGEKPWPFLATQFIDDQPQFSPDGRWLAYMSDETGRSEVYIQSFPKPGNSVTVSTGGASQPRWRKDGKELFFVTLDSMLMAAPIKAGGNELQVGEPEQLFRMPLRGAPNHYTYDVAPDGQRFLVTTPSDPGRPETLKVMLNWKAALSGK